MARKKYLRKQIYCQYLEEIGHLNTSCWSFPHARGDGPKAAQGELKSEKPNYVSSDLAKTFDSESRTPFKPEDSTLRHEPGSAFAKAYYDVLLANPKEADLPVLVLGGISGAGKTVATKHLTDVESYAAVYDTNLANVESAKRIIDKALNSNPERNVKIIYVDRDPKKAFIDGAYKRFRTHLERRIVPIPSFILTLGSRNVIAEISKLYEGNDRVGFTYVDNNYEAGHPKIATSLDHLPKWGYTKKELQDELEQYIEGEYHAGKITETEAETFLGRRVGLTGVSGEIQEVGRGRRQAIAEAGSRIRREETPTTEPPQPARPPRLKKVDFSAVKAQIQEAKKTAIDRSEVQKIIDSAEAIRLNTVFPTRVGMVLRVTCINVNLLCFPHARGDGPGW